MADRRVIYDPDLEVGAIIDLDENRAIGPISVGPNAAAELQQFVERMPEQVFTAMNSYELATAYMQFWDANFAAFYQEAAPDIADTVEPAPDGGANDAALAERAAAAVAGEPPVPAPSDTDVEADQGEAGPVTLETQDGAEAGAQAPQETRSQVVACFACSGTGRVPGGPDEVGVTCNLCQGTGRVERAVPA